MDLKPTCQICGKRGWHDAKDHDPVLDYPFCYLCRRVLNADDHPDADTDGEHCWCSWEHGPEGVAQIQQFQRDLDAEAGRTQEEWMAALRATIREEVLRELTARESRWQPKTKTASTSSTWRASAPRPTRF